MKVGDLVQVARHPDAGEIGIIVEWSQDGWLVHFPEHGCVFHMKPQSLEPIQ